LVGFTKFWPQNDLPLWKDSYKHNFVRTSTMHVKGRFYGYYSAHYVGTDTKKPQNPFSYLGIKENI